MTQSWGNLHIQNIPWQLQPPETEDCEAAGAGNGRQSIEMGRPTAPPGEG